MIEREEMMLKAALYYYEEEITQSEIAKLLKVSRPTVAALLQEAKDKGIVKITIQHSHLRSLKLQEKLVKKYQLANVKIASATKETESSLKAAAGKLCMELIEPLLPSIQRLGIGWGTTLFEYVQQANYLHLEPLKIIPLIGGNGLSTVRFHSNHLAFVLSQKYHCEVSYFYAPAIADTQAVRDTLVETNLIREVMEEGRQVDMAVLGVGDPVHSSTYEKLDYISDEDTALLINEGIIGDIGGTFFKANGAVLEKGIAQRMLGIKLADIKKINRVVVVATGKEKAKSIQTLLNMAVITDLIVDEELAQLL
ncbi:sugar-binding transcriptional regulator [Candidatus Enterococcus ferrettii]|uniref:Sugar-binding domain-containing protein n=1 Tax=Candidatus Enterococcus ferrettii TaxID=2815324 RepID=A0ABV0ESX1_9ENTE|nr:sugar-binding domain-containing protein [Enterococcus sp. 665A]MBO1341509.1 winged helix-turn-helix transcriptional regulator [Enterococcus sp. 665A]